MSDLLVMNGNNLESVVCVDLGFRGFGFCYFLKIEFWFKLFICD